MSMTLTEVVEKLDLACSAALLASTENRDCDTMEAHYAGRADGLAVGRDLLCNYLAREAVEEIVKPDELQALREAVRAGLQELQASWIGSPHRTGVKIAIDMMRTHVGPHMGEASPQ